MNEAHETARDVLVDLQAQAMIEHYQPWQRTAQRRPKR